MQISTTTFIDRFQVAVVMATQTNGHRRIATDQTDSQLMTIRQPQRSNRKPTHNSYLNVCGREGQKPANRRSTDSASISVNTLFANPIQGLNTHTCIALPRVSKSLAFVPPRAFAGRARSGGAPHQQPVGLTVGQPRQAPEAATQQGY